MAKKKAAADAPIAAKAFDTQEEYLESREGHEKDVSEYFANVDPNYVPEGFETAEEFLDDMRQEYQLDLDFDRLNREAAMEDKRFAAGEQWDPVVLEQRKGLPSLIINQIPQFTAQVVGDWRESRKAVKVLASFDEDQNVADVRGDLIRSIEAASRADRVYDTAFESLLQCGDGAFRVCVEYARDDVFDQDVFIRPIEDALAVVWDRYSVDPTGRDARHCFVDDRIPKKEFNRKYPDVAEAKLDDGMWMQRIDIQNWADADGYKLTEYWRLVERQRILALFSNGKMFEVTGDNMAQLIMENGKPAKVRVSTVSYAQMHLCTGFAILAGPFEYRLTRLPVIRMSGRVVNVGGRRVRYGIVRFMKDPARLRNFWRSVAAEQLGYAPKAAWIATQSAVEGRENELRKAHLSRDPLIIVNDEAIFGTNIMRVEPPTIQQALLNEAQVNVQDMKDVTGIQDASLGIKSNEVSGRAIDARQHEGDIAALTYFDNGDAAVLEAGDVINQYIPQIYDGTRVIRTIGADETIKFQKINDPMNPESVDLSVGKYDVALTTGTSYTTRRQAAAQAMMDAIQVWPQLMQVAGDLVAKAQDWPGAEQLAERLAKTIPPQYLSDKEQKEMGGPGIDPEQFQQMQALLQKLQMENQSLKMDKSIDMYNAETQRIRALSDNMVDGNEMELKAIQHIIETSVKLDEHQIQREQMGHDHMSAAGELAVKHNKVLADALTKVHATNSRPKPSSQGGGQSSATSSTPAP